ncbi:thioesterase [Francisella halioticida]|uniref:Thioesterase n=1 Tax=Francisella halioticida TaxID=549298 RepID=A0ABN5B2M8_9GAMM|nr:thioesterase family protein [Francisella halioticida]ASG68892.1 thioesterase [Francisella halioticida]BCD91882.1 thioesterase [Francisella halioticida]
MKQHSLFTYYFNMEIPFFDTDMLQIVWHGHYIKYFEMARCGMLEHINYDYIQMKNDGYAWPVVDVRLECIKPASFKQKIYIQCDLIEFEYRLKINHIIRDQSTDIKITEGSIVQLAVNIEKKETCFITPKQWQQKIKGLIENEKNNVIHS